MSQNSKNTHTNHLSPTPLKLLPPSLSPKKYSSKTPLSLIPRRSKSPNTSNAQPGIIEVYDDNFLEEMKNISNLLDEYNYIGMDTEFPGTVYNIPNMSKDFYFRTLKMNVDLLKLIQLGITLTNSKGEFPKNYPYHTWQFNFEFDKDKDKILTSSLNLLEDCGIDFAKLKKKGIKHKKFAEYFMTSGLVLNPDITWVSFHGCYDFGYLLKLLLNSNLPDNENDFLCDLNTYFINFYDIRTLVKGKDKLQGGLNKLAQNLDIYREGKIHQAGSDSVVTIDVYFKLVKDSLIDDKKLRKNKNTLFGVNSEEDNKETIYYTKIGNNTFGNNNNSTLGNNISNISNMMYPSSLGSGFVNVNMPYYYMVNNMGN